MAKVLLTRKNIEEHICRETGSLYADKGVIIPPGIKDYLQNIGISIRYEPKPAESTEDREKTAAVLEAAESADVESIAALTRRIVAILQDEYQVRDEETLRELCLRVAREVDHATDRNL